MFKVYKDQLSEFERITLLNDDTAERVSVIPSFGANVNSIVLDKGNKLYELLNGDKTAQELRKNCCFKGAKLTPFPNRVCDGKYTFKGTEYKLQQNFPAESHAIHGLVYNKEFKVEESREGDDYCYVILKHCYSSNEPGYPFDFTIEQILLLNKKGFEVATSITNQSKEDMPLGDGWHPYFQLDRQVNSMELQIPDSEKILVNERLIPTGEYENFTLFQELTKIDNVDFDTGFRVKKNGIATTSLYSVEEDVELSVWQESETGKYKYLQVYIPPDRRSIAIEPMTCAANALNSGEGLIVLKPGEVFKGRYGVYLG